MENVPTIVDDENTTQEDTLLMESKGSARLLRRFIRPALRDVQGMVTTEVREVYNTACATSPHKRDGMQQRCLSQHGAQDA